MVRRGARAPRGGLGGRPRPRGGRRRGALARGLARRGAARPGGERPDPAALRADARLFDPEGEPAYASLTLAGELRVLFDDPAVQRARQRVLADGTLGLVTTLSADPSRIGGSLLAARGADAPRIVRDDPFAAVLPRTLLGVGPGLLGRPLPPPGPVLERYAGAPWPVDRF